MNLSSTFAAAVTLAVSVVGSVGGSVVGATGAHAGETQPQLVGAEKPQVRVQDYIVVLEDGARMPTALDRAQVGYDATVENVYRTALKGYSAQMTAAEAAALSQAPGVDFVQPNIRFEITGQSMPTGVNRTNADLSPTAAINRRDQRVNIDVAVIDTGVDLDHPDLNVYQRGAKNCSYFARGANDQHGHGTHVAGTIGALDNGRGVVGMAPGARIWPVRVFDNSGAGSLAEVICGVDYVTRHAKQIDVANMSLSSIGGRDDGACGNSYGDALHKAICRSVRAGVTYVAAAGNSAQDASLATPASYDEVITVSALADFNGRAGGGARATCRPDVDDTFADFSNYGGDVDIVAPGVCIRSTWVGGRYSALSGTSMASPHVAGAAALYLAKHPRATPATVRNVLVRNGSANWRNTDDPDARREPLLNVRGF
jgi:subtilisin